MSTWNLSAIGVILLGDSKKSDGRHEGGHQGESNRSDLGPILNKKNNYFLTWQLFIQQFKGEEFTAIAPSASKYSLLVFWRPPLSLMSFSFVT